MMYENGMQHIERNIREIIGKMNESSLLMFQCDASNYKRQLAAKWGNVRIAYRNGFAPIKSRYMRVLFTFGKSDELGDQRREPAVLAYRPWTNESNVVRFNKLTGDKTVREKN